jgi:voltage-gated potassium channel Kch
VQGPTGIRRRGPVGSRLTRRAGIALQKRRVFAFLVGTTAVVAVLTGLIAHLIDRTDFPTFGIGVWWSIVTLATVGYGDVVPHTAWGRVLGGVVIVFGVTFLSFLVAIVTSLFVDSSRADDEDERNVQHEENQALLRDISARLDAIETRLGPAPDTHPE